MLSEEVWACLSVFASFFFLLPLTTDTPSLLLFFWCPPFYCWLLIGKPCLAPCVTVTLSLSWDPFDVVGHNEIPLHLGQFSVWRLILHEPISRALRHPRTRKPAVHTHTYSSPNQSDRTPPSRKRRVSHIHTKRTPLFCCFTMQTRKEAKGIMVIILQEQNNLLRRGKRAIWMCR